MRLEEGDDGTAAATRQGETAARSSMQVTTIVTLVRSSRAMLPAACGCNAEDHNWCTMEFKRAYMWARRGEERGAHTMMVAEVLMVAATTLMPAEMQRFMFKPPESAHDDAASEEKEEVDAGRDDDDEEGDAMSGLHSASRALATMSATASSA